MKDLVKKKTTRIVGIVTVLVLAMIIAAVTAVTTTKVQTAQAVHSPLNVAVYIGNGASADSIIATLRAVQSCGYSIYGINSDDITQGRLTTTNYDVLLLPEGTDNNADWYVIEYNGVGFSAANKTNVRNFCSSGGGVVGLGAGAQFMSTGTITAPGYTTAYSCLSLYNTAYTTQNTAGKATLTIQNSGWGTVGSTQELYRQGGTAYGFGSKTNGTAGGYWASLPTGGTQVATALFNSAAKTVVGCGTYGTSGHVAVCSFDPQFRGDSLLDWTEWDNWAMSSAQTNSVGGWSMIGRMINYAATGTATAPTITSTNPTGHNVAIYGTYTYYYGGGYSGNLPGIARAVANAGDIPLVIRANDVSTRLIAANFKSIILPGGYTLGYKESLGSSKTTGDSSKIVTFANAGGGVMGICAGAYYLCANISYDGTNVAELGLYGGNGNGELTDISTYPNGALTPIATNDTYLGNLGTLQIFYEGGPYFPTPLSSSATTVSTYAYTGTYAGTSAAIRFKYGTGHVLLVGPHPEVRNGSNDDWMTWDNYVNGSNTPLNNSTNPWLFFTPALDNWLNSTV